MRLSLPVCSRMNSSYLEVYYSSVNPLMYLYTGERFENETSTFYNDLYVYSPCHNRWTKYTCPTAPLPRSGHQMAVHPLTGMMYLFGGPIPYKLTNTYQQANFQVQR